MRGLLVVIVVLAVGRPAAGNPPAGDSPAPKPGVPAQSPAVESKPAEKPFTVEQVAEAVLAAQLAKDEAGLKTLALKDDPDPWLVADELVRRGEFDAAEAFAKAAPRKDVEKLPEYVASRRGKPDDAATRKPLAAANEALAAGKPKDALDALGLPEKGSIEDVVRVRLAMARGVALASLVRLEEIRSQVTFPQPSAATAGGQMTWARSGPPSCSCTSCGRHAWSPKVTPCDGSRSGLAWRAAERSPGSMLCRRETRKGHQGRGGQGELRPPRRERTLARLPLPAGHVRQPARGGRGPSARRPGSREARKAGDDHVGLHGSPQSRPARGP